MGFYYILEESILLLDKTSYCILKRPHRPRFNIKMSSYQYRIHIMKIRPSSHSQIYINGIPILVRRPLYVDTVPWTHFVVEIFAQTNTIYSIIRRCRQAAACGYHWVECKRMAWKLMISWWRHQMETVPALLALCEGNPPVTGGFPSQRDSNTGFDAFFDVSLNKRLNKQTRRRWFETPSRRPVCPFFNLTPPPYCFCEIF